MASKINKNMFLVNAPAGSGKTTEIKRMLKQISYENPKDNILCITYTNRAAEELSADIKTPNIYIGTIHSFLNMFINRYFSHSDVLKLFFEIYGADINKRIINEEAKDNIKESNSRYIEKFGGLSFELIKSNIKLIYYNESPFNSLYYGGISHDSLISFSKKIIDSFPIIKTRISSKYQYIFIDEYQDTTSDVLNIFYDSIANTNCHLYLFGDKMQQIYNNYDGSFEDMFPLFDTSKSLKYNHRSVPQIVTLLNNIYNDNNLKQESSKEVCDNISLPKVLICNDIQQTISSLSNESSDILVLYLLNRQRFEAIGASNLYSFYSHMNEYSYGKTHSSVDILTTEYSENPDTLIKLLYLVVSIFHDYNAVRYGVIIQKLKLNYAIFDQNTCNIKSHKDKHSLLGKLKVIFDIFNDPSQTIANLLDKLRELSVVQGEYINNILADDEYKEVINVNMTEPLAVVNYLSDPKISTQHGVKGESHENVIFVAEDSLRTPVVHMYSLFEMWGQLDISLPTFQGFYYSYAKLLANLENEIEIKVSGLNAKTYKDYESILIKNAKAIIAKFEQNKIFIFLCVSAYNEFLKKPNVSNAKSCFKASRVDGVLSAYKLFYVGCSRSRQKLTVLLDRSKVKSDIDPQIKRFTKLGFIVEEV